MHIDDGKMNEPYSFMAPAIKKNGTTGAIASRPGK